jgi:hypothetical protein
MGQGSLAAKSQIVTEAGRMEDVIVRNSDSECGAREWVPSDSERTLRSRSVVWARVQG